MKCIVCSAEIYTVIGVYCDDCRSIPYEGGNNRKDEPIFTISQRWGMIGANSSVDAMEEVRNLRNPKLIMSNF